MRQVFVSLGLFTSILAVVLAVTSYSQWAFIPTLLALVLGLTAFYLSRQKQYPKKSIQLIFILTIVAMVINTYKSVYEIVEIENIDNLENSTQKSIENDKKNMKQLDRLKLHDSIK